LARAAFVLRAGEHSIRLARNFRMDPPTRTYLLGTLRLLSMGLQDLQDLALQWTVHSNKEDLQARSRAARIALYGPAIWKKDEVVGATGPSCTRKAHWGELDSSESRSPKLITCERCFWLIVAGGRVACARSPGRQVVSAFRLDLRDTCN